MQKHDIQTVHLSDRELLSEVKRLVACEREATARLIVSLAELDARRLYLGEGCSSLFTYCTQVLHLSEHAAYGRIEAARAGRRFPIILERLREGSLTLTAVGLLARHLTEENYRQLLDAARHRSKREIEQLVADLQPQPPAVTVVRKLPDPPRRGPLKVLAGPHPRSLALGGSAAPRFPLAPRAGRRRLRTFAPAQDVSPPAESKDVPACHTPVVRPAEVRPLGPERYKIQLTVSAATHTKLRRAQDLLRHAVPDGDPAAIIDRALTVLVTQLEKQKFALTARPTGGAPRRPRRHFASPGPQRTELGSSEPAPGTRPAREPRHVPAAVRRTVWARDEGRCAFVGASGRCTERGPLEFHHVVPYAEGGKGTIDNIQLRCRDHNGYEAERWFGPLLVRERRVGYFVNSVLDRVAVRALGASGAAGDRLARSSRGSSAPRNARL